MQLPEPSRACPTATGRAAFLDSFLRGNRDDQPRKRDGSILQALNLMNDNFVVDASQPLANASQLHRCRTSSRSNHDLVNAAVPDDPLALSHRATRWPAALAALPSAGGTRAPAAVQDLVWSLYNKVDFVFNY